MQVILTKRTSLASDIAYEVRRGWAELYGGAIAESSTQGLQAKIGRFIPGRLDLLSDYVGWVPDPGYGTMEAVGTPVETPFNFHCKFRHWMHMSLR